MMRFCHAMVTALILFSLYAFGQSEPTEAQYAVYSAFLRIQLDGDLRVGPNGSALSPVIEPWELNVERKRKIKEELPQIENETLESLSRCSTKAYRLGSRLRIPIDYNFLPERAGRQYGYIQFSCVGINRNGTQAAFYVSRLNCECAVGKMVLMQKVTNGSWVIVKESVEWIA